MKRTVLWIVVIVLGIAALFVLPGLFGFGCCGWGGYGMMGGYARPGYGMMGGWWGPLMFLGWLIPVGFLILVIAGGVWLGNALANRGNGAPTASALTCPDCGKPIARDWKVCPYCGTDLGKAAE